MRPTAVKIEPHPGVVYYTDTPTALTRLHELHVRSVGGVEKFRTPGIAELTPTEAFYQFSDAYAIGLAQLAVSPPAAQISLLEAVSDTIEDLGSMAGLEGMLLNAGRASQYHLADAEASLVRAGGIFAELGMPSELGGSVISDLLLDHGTGVMSYIDAAGIGNVLDGLPDAWTKLPGTSGARGGIGDGLRGFDLLFSGDAPGAGLRGGVDIGGLTGEGYLYGDSGAETGAKVGAVVGSAVGAVAGFFVGLPSGPGSVVSGAAGGVAGGAIGGSIGAAVGMAVGWASDRPAPTPDPSHGSPYGPYGPFLGPYVDGPSVGTGTAPSSGSGGTAPPAGSGGTAPPAGSGGTAPPAASGGTAPPAGSGGTAPPAGSGGTAPPSGSGGTAPSTGTDGQRPHVKPGSSDKLPVGDFEGGGERGSGGVAPARFPVGEGMARLMIEMANEALGFVTIPAFDDSLELASTGFYPITAPGDAETIYVPQPNRVIDNVDGYGGTGPIQPDWLQAKVVGLRDLLESRRGADLLESAQEVVTALESDRRTALIQRARTVNSPQVAEVTNTRAAMVWDPLASGWVQA